MNPILILMAALVLQDPAASPKTSSEPAQRTTPLALTFNVPPGYQRSVSLDIPEDGAIEVMVEAVVQDPSPKWKPTAFIKLVNDKSDLQYFLNISVDLDLQQQFVRTRLIDAKKKRELTNQVHPALLELSSVNTLKIVVKGKTIDCYVNGEPVERRELPFEPQYYDLGASSGTYRVTVIEPAPAPAPD